MKEALNQIFQITGIPKERMGEPRDQNFQASAASIKAFARKINNPTYTLPETRETLKAAPVTE